MAIEEVSVPDIGGSEGAEVVELLVAVGDSVGVDQGLVVLESDKASMEIPSTAAGKIVELLVAEGDQLAEGAPIARIETAESGSNSETDSDSGSSSKSDAEKDLEKDTEKDSEKDPEKDPEKDSEKDPEKDSEKDPEKDSEKDPEKDPEKDTEKDTDSDTGSGSAETPVSEPKAGEAESKPGTESAQKGVAAKPSTATQSPPSEVASNEGVYAGPAVRKLAREFGLPLAKVTGSGPSGRILKEDLHSFAQRMFAGDEANSGGTGIPVVPEVDFAEYGDVEVTKRSKMDKLTAVNMHRSWLNVPHVTQMDEADITDLESFRRDLKAQAEQREVKLSPLPFILKACAVALRDNPQLNSSLSGVGEELVYKHYLHIGIAVDTPAGLVVPVIRDVDQKSIWDIAAEVLVLAGKARERKLTPTEMRGGCFTVSSLGNIGGTGFTPIVNTPEVGILGVSRAGVKPVWDGNAFVPRTMLPLSLSYDHRVVNGGHGGRFLSQVVALLGDIRQLAM